MNKKRTITSLEERILGGSLNLIFFGFSVIIFNMIGVPLDVKTGAGIAIFGVCAIVLTFIIGLIIHFARSLKENGNG